MILGNNRPGETRGIPLPLGIPAGMIADLDYARLRAYMATTGGETRITLGRDFERIETGRSGVVTDFSSGGPTALEHLLKPDVAAPGGAILSATLPASGGPFAVFDGTSMSAPHVAGMAALLIERHRGWNARQLKSAIVSTAGPAWMNTARTQEASVLLAGSGLANVQRADDPRIFTDPTSLSFQDLDVNEGHQTRDRLLRVLDAGGGAGTWQVEVRPQSASAGAYIELPSAVSVPPGGATTLPVAAQARGDAVAGDNFGHIVLRQGNVERRIAYAFFVTRPQLVKKRVEPLRKFVVGDTRQGESVVSSYRFPTAPFGPPPDYTGPAVTEPGAERVFSTLLDTPAANLGVSVLQSTPAGAGIDPWLLGSLDENDVEGQAGTPVNVNALTYDYQLPVGAAAVVFPRQKRYYVVVDSGVDQFTGRSLAGRYLLNSWVNDVSPPFLGMVTTRVSAGRPILVARALDFQSGVDPLSLVIGYQRVLVGAAAYDPFTGYVLFELPRQAPRLRAGRTLGVLVAHDFQETKNVDTPGDDILPNTSFAPARIRVVNGPAVTWLAPEVRQCVGASARLLVTASSTRPVRTVVFYADQKKIATQRGNLGVYAATWRTRGVKSGPHVVRAVVTDAAGKSFAASRIVRVCR
jgi:hypothetical protein